MSYIESLFSLKDSVSIVIGGSGVLGGEMAQALSRAGSKTAVFYSGSKEGADERAELIEKDGGEAMVCQADVRNEDSLKKAIGQVVDEWGRVDTLRSEERRVGREGRSGGA